jgi:hypothetical protein
MTRAVAKITKHQGMLTVDEMDSLSALVKKVVDDDAKSEENAAKSKAAQSATNKMVSDVLTKLLSAITEDPTVEKAGEELAGALDTNDAGKFTQTLQPILIKASQAAMGFQQLKANAIATLQAQQQQQQSANPQGDATYAAFIQWHNKKQQQSNYNQPATTMSSTPAQLYNPLVNASLSSMAAQRPQLQPQAQQAYQPQTSFTRHLPYNPQFSPMFDLLGNKNYGDAFVPTQTWDNQSTLREFCNGPNGSAAQQQYQPTAAETESMVGNSMLSMPAKRARME